MQDWILTLVEEYGYLGVLLLIAVENLLPPIPSEAILTFGGFMTTRSSMTPVGVVFCATLGSVAGALALYRIGAQLGRQRVEVLVSRHGRLLRVRVDDIRRAYGWFERRGARAVFLCRMVPLLRSLISIPAGMARMPLGSFTLLTAVGSLIWNTVLVTAGVLLGEAWGEILGVFRVYSTAVVAALGVACALLVALWLRRRGGLL